MPEAIEIQIDHRCGVEGQDLAQEQSSDDGDAERLAELAAFAHADDQRDRAEQRRHGGHHDRPEAQQASLVDCIGR